MKRLIKKSNHVDPTIHMEVEDKVVNPHLNINDRQRPAFLLARNLFADTTYVPTGTVTYQFAKKIENGEYEHISSIESAKDHWDEWLNALHEFINEHTEGLRVTSKKKRLANKNSLYDDKYNDILFTDNYLDREKDLKKNQQNQPKSEKEEFISKSFQIAKELIHGLPIVPRYDLISQLAQDIERGDFDDLGEFEENREAYFNRTKSILRARNIMLN